MMGKKTNCKPISSVLFELCKKNRIFLHFFLARNTNKPYSLKCNLLHVSVSVTSATVL